MKYPSRNYLQLLDSSENVDLSKNILQSPLGLSYEIVKLLFEDNFEELSKHLDIIKDFAGGLAKARTLSSSYPLARYYPYMFSFHQYFNSSFRARQGYVLESLLKNVLKKYNVFEIVPDKKTESKRILSDILGLDSLKLDIDGFGYSPNLNKCIIVQLRSRDDTGGTTAKGSLVDLLRRIIQSNNDNHVSILYLIGIWDPRDSAQKKSTIDKIYSSLQDTISIDKNNLNNSIETGYEIKKDIILRLAYSSGEIIKAIYEWADVKDASFLKSTSDLISIIESWDDLWVAYSVASLEIEYPALKKYSNIKLVNKYFDEVGGDFGFSSYSNLEASIDRALNEMIKIWEEESMLFNSIAHNAIYIRDLLFLKAIYAKRTI